MAALRRCYITSIVSFLGLAVGLLVFAAPSLRGQNLAPDGGIKSVQPNKTGLKATFSLSSGQPSSQTWSLEWVCYIPVTNCNRPEGSSVTFTWSTSVDITFSSASAGTGQLILRAWGPSGQDTGYYNVTIDGTAPDIRLLAPTGEVAAEYPTIQVAWCDNNSLNSSSRWIHVNGVAKTSSFDYVAGGPADCVVKATSTTSSVPLAVGSNTVTARICDNALNCMTESFPITRVITGVAVNPDGATAQQRAANTSGHTDNFTVQNTGTGQNTYSLSCSGSASVACTEMTIYGTPVTSVILPAGDSTVVTARYNVGAVGTGSLTVTASGTSASDGGSYSVPVVTANAQPPVVDLNAVNPGDAINRSLCLTVSAGPAAAYECGDLRVVHPLPTTRTLNKPRTPTLLYSSHTAHPYPLVAANVTLPSSAAVPDSVTGTLTISGVTRAQAKWAGNQWTAGQTRRVVLGFDGLNDAAGILSYTLEVTNWYPSPIDPQPTIATGQLAIVNRNGSSFGAGWWLAGLEQLFSLPDGRKLVVLGDGSVRVYSTVAPNLYTAPNPSRPDTLDGRGTDYVRLGEHGVRVHYSASTGKHIATVNRLGHKTEFRYDEACGRLSKILLPPDTTRVYTFTYTSPTDCSTRLASVTAPPNGAQSRVTNVTVTAGRVTAIRDPDLLSVGFGYDPGFANRITARTDRRGAVTHYGFDAGGKLSVDSLPLEAGQTPIVQKVRPLESLGLGASVDTASAYTRLDGPRADVPDTAAFWLDRFGAPRRVVNAIGHKTLVYRDDPNFPALVTEVRSPNGFVTRAKYDGRGNIDTLMQLNPLGDGRNAITRFHWDPRWDFVDSIVTPTGVTTTFAYDADNGNRLWQQVGSDSVRRVRFRYGNSLGLLSSTILPGTPPDSIEYDGMGNLRTLRTPKQFDTRFTSDAIGRDTMVQVRIDTLSAIYQTTITHFDVVDRDTLQKMIGPALSGAAAETVYVRKVYNATGQVDTLRRWSRPDPASIGTMTTHWQYDLARRTVREVAPDGRQERWVYDPAGNVVSDSTRRGHVVTMAYDTLNRLRQRVVPQTHYDQRFDGIPEDNQGGIIPTTPYPLYPNDGGSGYLVPADVATFTYDITGGLRTADNGSARIARGYYPNGAIKADTQRIRTVNGNDLDQHRYVLQYVYDLEGRRIELIHPSQLAAGAPHDRTTHQYDPVTGLLSQVTDLRDNVFQLGYDFKGQLTSLTLPGGISETYEYDADGRLRTQRLLNGSNSVYKWPESYLRNASYAYDAGGRMLYSHNTAGTADTLFARYSGLGQLVRDSMRTRGEASVIFPDGGIGPFPIRYDAIETFTLDALGNVNQSQTTTRVWADDGEQTGTNETIQSYQVNVGRLARHTINWRVDTLVYDEAGNTIWMSTLANDVLSHQDRASYYSADGKLVAADRRSINSSGHWSNFEESRYDALGRRVWVRARNACQGHGSDPLCDISTIRRIVWDGDRELYEIQMPGGDADGTWLENDVAQVDLPIIVGEDNGLNYDRNVYFGRVAYTTGLSIDQPLSIIRFGYRSLMGQNGDARTPLNWAPFAIMPYWNARGLADIGTFEDGGVDRCTTFEGVLRCIWVDWPAQVYAYARNGMRRNAWHGSVPEDKADASGTYFRRNRLYDPATGRFTQEDPIGLAGGLNLYGFANGDPVNFSDPFGLIPFVNCRPVTGNPEFGHCAVRVIDKERGLDVTIQLIPGDPSIAAPLGRNRVYWSHGADNEKTKAFDPNGWVEVATPEGMTAQELDQAILKSAVREAERSVDAPYFFSGGRNSNGFVYRVVTGAGAKVPGAPAKRFPKGAPGLCGGGGFDTGASCVK